MKLTPAQRKVLERLKAGKTCVYSTFREAWIFLGDTRSLRYETTAELFAKKLVSKRIEGSGFAKSRYLDLTDAGRAFLE